MRTVLFSLMVVGAFAACKKQDASTGTAAPATEAVACPADTQTCPDGSVVSRDPNAGCEFAACAPAAK